MLGGWIDGLTIPLCPNTFMRDTECLMLEPFHNIYRDLLHYKCRFEWRPEYGGIMLVGNQKPYPATYHINYNIEFLVPYMIDLKEAYARTHTPNI